MESCTIRWAQEEFGQAELGHKSRTKRVVKMAAAVADKPAGRISEVFGKPADRQGAYCLVQNSAVDPRRLLSSMQQATLQRCSEHSWVFVPVDGSSLTLTDRSGSTDFGSVGPHRYGARGLKVIDALAVSPRGTPLGVTSLQWWCRTRTKRRTSHIKRRVGDKETQHWLDAIEDSRQLFEGSSTRLWFLLDREADAWPTLHALHNSGHWFTVRSNHDRRLHPQPQYLHRKLRKQRCLGHMRLTVTAAPGRKARKAKLSVRVLNDVELRMRDGWSHTIRPLHLNAVMVTEVHTTPAGEKPLQWCLLTNRPLKNLADAVVVARGYSYRWRIEDFHRTWKRGACGVEDSQLRSSLHVQRWATILAAVASRVERLRHLMREQPNEPATIELSEFEIEVLKRDVFSPDGYIIKSRAKPPPEGIPTIEQAVYWIAGMGGYNRYARHKPGATSISRGLQRLDTLVAGARLALDAKLNLPKKID